MGRHTGTVFLTNANWGWHTGKCKLGPPKTGHATTKLMVWIFEVGTW